MSKVTVRIDLEEIKEAISRLSDGEKESLFFELNSVWGKALQKMEQEALKNLREGKTIPLLSAAFSKLRKVVVGASGENTGLFMP